MNILTKLTLLRFRQHRSRTILTLTALLLSSLMLTMVVGLVYSARGYLHDRYMYTEGNHHAVISGLEEDDIRRLQDHPEIAEVSTRDRGDGETVVYLRWKKAPRMIDWELKHLLEETTGRKVDGENVTYHFHTQLLAMERFFSEQSRVVSLEGALVVLLAIVGFSSVVVLSNAFYVSGDERAVEFATLRSVGATSDQIQTLVKTEAYLLAGAAIPCGMALGVLGTWIAVRVAGRILPELSVMKLQFSVPALGLVVLVCFLVLYLSVRAPAIRAASHTPTEVLRYQHSIRREKEKKRLRKTKGRVVEFSLARRFMQRQSRVYRATVLSLVMAMVIFLGVSSFAQQLRVLADRTLNAGMAAAEVRVYPAPDDAKTAAFRQRLREETDVPVHTAWRQPLLLHENEVQALYDAGSDLDEYRANRVEIVRVVYVEDALWKEMVRLSDTDASADTPAIALEQRASEDIWRIFDFDAPHRLTSAEEGEPEVTLIGKVEVRDLGAPWRGLFLDTMQLDARLVLAMPASAGTVFAGAQWEPTLTFLADPPDVSAFLKTTGRLAEELGIAQDDLLLRNHEEVNTRTQRMHLLVQFFAYGLVALLSLIGITGMWYTMMTGIAQRKREFSVLISVGMSRDSLFKVLFYETVRMVGITLGIGLPLGILVNWISYLFLLHSTGAEFYISIRQIVIVVLAIGLLAYVMLAYAHRTAYRLKPAPILKRSAV